MLFNLFYENNGVILLSVVQEEWCSYRNF